MQISEFVNSYIAPVVHFYEERIYGRGSLLFSAVLRGRLRRWVWLLRTCIVSSRLKWGTRPVLNFLGAPMIL
jgi:hypothetical protein